MLDEFTEFIDENNILVSIVGTILSISIIDFAKSIIDNLLIPIFDDNDDEKDDEKDNEKTSFIISGKKCKHKYKLCVLDFIRFFAIITLLYCLTKILPKRRI
jgi:large-conductance mechanosensitive channel